MLNNKTPLFLGDANVEYFSYNSNHKQFIFNIFLQYSNQFHLRFVATKKKKLANPLPYFHTPLHMVTAFHSIVCTTNHSRHYTSNQSICKDSRQPTSPGKYHKSFTAMGN